MCQLYSIKIISILPSKPWVFYGLLIVALLKERNESMPSPLGDTLVPPLFLLLFVVSAMGELFFTFRRKQEHSQILLIGLQSCT